MIEQLRIGNKFNYHDQEVSVVLIGLTYAEFGYITDSVGFRRRYDDKDFPKPIPLTKEWLERMGLVLHDLDSWSDPYLEDVVGQYDGDDKYYYVLSSSEDTYGGWEYSTIEVQSIHDVQNIYYYNNNKTELTIKEL